MVSKVIEPTGSVLVEAAYLDRTGELLTQVDRLTRQHAHWVRQRDALIHEWHVEQFELAQAEAARQAWLNAAMHLQNHQQDQRMYGVQRALESAKLSSQKAFEQRKRMIADEEELRAYRQRLERWRLGREAERVREARDRLERERRQSLCWEKVALDRQRERERAQERERVAEIKQQTAKEASERRAQERAARKKEREEEREKELQHAKDLALLHQQGVETQAQSRRTQRSESNAASDAKESVMEESEQESKPSKSGSDRTSDESAKSKGTVMTKSSGAEESRSFWSGVGLDPSSTAPVPVKDDDSMSEGIAESIESFVSQVDDSDV